MPLFDHLRLADGENFTFDKWEELINSLEDLSLTIPDNRDGEIINEVAIGTKPGDGSELNYPWAKETIGVSKKTSNLRLQSPSSVFVHTNIDENEAANKTKVPLAIMKDGKVGIGTITPTHLLTVNGEVISKGWIRVKGDRGLYFQDFGGGFHMNDKIWIRTYGASSLHINKHLNVAANTTLKGSLTVAKGITISGTSTFKNNLNVEANTALKGSLTVGKEMTISGNSTLKKNLSVTGTIHSKNIIQSSGRSGGFKYPDGGLQTKASTVNVMRSGTVQMNRTSGWRTSPLATGKSYTSPTIRLSGFTQTPTILLSISYLDTSTGANARIRFKKMNVSKSGFKVKFETWADSKVYQCILDWVALGT